MRADDMTRYRIDIEHPPTDHVEFPVTEPTTRLLWRPEAASANIECSSRFFLGWRPTRAAEDLLLIAAASYCADKLTARSATADAWTRTIELDVPVSDPRRFQDGPLADTLRFLSGDLWTLRFRPTSTRPLSTLPDLPTDKSLAAPVDVVSLFSGGLDSLCGVIDLLEQDPERRVGLVGHYDGGQATSRQQQLHQQLADHYGADRVPLYQLWLRPAPPNPAQAQPTPPTIENTTRARSLLFLTAALAVASSAGPAIPVVLPENGYIALNVPLTRARNGSASTRTTHPHFLAGYTAAAVLAGVVNPVNNPYLYLTKGEMLATSANQLLLAKLAPRTVSCSHPEAARMQQRPQGNCGYCFPCIIRRASMAAVGWDSADDYAWDALTDGSLATRTDLQRGSDLRAVINAVYLRRKDIDVVRNGPLPTGTHAAHVSTWRRGNAEIQSWLEGGATGQLADLVGRLQ